MKPDDLRGIYREIALETNIETAQKIHKMLGGQQIDFPKKLYSSGYINSKIIADYNGKNTHELAQKYGISERRIRQILNPCK